MTRKEKVEFAVGVGLMALYAGFWGAAVALRHARKRGKNGAGV